MKTTLGVVLLAAVAVVDANAQVVGDDACPLYAAMSTA